MELRIFCEFFYASHYVPVTVLQGGQVLFYFTADGMPITFQWLKSAHPLKIPMCLVQVTGSTVGFD